MWITHISNVDGYFYVMLLGYASAVFVVLRVVLLASIKIARKMRLNLRNVIVVGLNDRSKDAVQKMSDPLIGVNFIGFVDTADRFKEKSSDLQGSEFNIFCTMECFSDCISAYPIDEVLIMLPIKGFYDDINEIIASCATQGIKSRHVADLFDLQFEIPRNIQPDSPAPAISYDINNLSEFQLDIKRMLDVVLSITGLIVSWPLFVIIPVLIYFDDGLPAIYVQERIGRNKKRFKMLKFRSMVKNADTFQSQLETENEIKGAAFKITNDPRITKIGSILRKTSLDELPQLLNVLMGSMSLVGPRPLPIRDFELFYEEKHRRRFSVKPGITGLWQISGRSDIDFERWMALDIAYIERWSLYLDLRILLATIPAVLKRKGAK